MVSVCLCAGLTIIVILLIVKRIVLRRDIDALREEFAARLFADSNTGIRTASADPALLRLAETLDGQVKRMRLAQIRYEGNFTFEADNFLIKMPRELMPEASRLMAQTGRYLIGRIEALQRA